MTEPMYSQDVLDALDQMLEVVGTEETLVVLRHLEQALPALFVQYIERGRDEGLKWVDIGDLLGTTRQGAFNRYNHHVRAVGVSPGRDQMTLDEACEPSPVAL